MNLGRFNTPETGSKDCNSPVCRKLANRLREKERHSFAGRFENGTRRIMKILSALFDTVLLPVEMVKDVFTLGNALERKSFTRKQIEKIEDELQP